MLIARLAVELHCYIPEELDETWAHLRQLGRRRARLVSAETAAVLRIQDFLSGGVAVGDGGVRAATGVGDLAGGAAGGDVSVRRGTGVGWPAGERRRSPHWWGRPCRAGAGSGPAARVLRGVFAALTDTEGAVGWSRRGLLRRVADELGDLRRARAQLRAVEAGHGWACWTSSGCPGWRTSPR